MDIQNLLKSLHISLLNVDECLAENWNFRKITSPFTRLYLIKNGGGSITHNHNTYELKPGRLYLIPSFTLCTYSSASFLDHFYIHFIPQVTSGTDLFKQLEFKYELLASETEIGLIKRILELNPTRKLVDLDPKKYYKKELIPHNPTIVSRQQIARSMETQGILLQLFSRFICIGNQTGAVPGLHPNAKISHAVDYIQRNLAKPINIAELAGVCHLSNDYFSRLFLKTMGTRPIDYINRKRIEEAQLHLVSTNDSMEKIALEVGIVNLSYFNRLFKKYLASTPGEYRILHRLV